MNTETEQAIAKAVNASDIFSHSEGERDWIVVKGITVTDTEGYAWIKSTMAQLKQQGWSCTAHSVGSRYVPHAHHESRVWAERGTGPLTCHERHMIATCSGRD